MESLFEYHFIHCTELYYFQKHLNLGGLKFIFFQGEAQLQNTLVEVALHSKHSTCMEYLLCLIKWNPNKEIKLNLNLNFGQNTHIL